MIGYIYAGFWIIAIIFLIFGYLLKGEADIFLYLGYAFMFLLSTLLIPGVPGSLEVLNETEIWYQYGDNYSGYHWDYSSPSPSVNDVNLFHTHETYDYEEYKNATFGIYLSIFSIFGFISVFLRRRDNDFGDN